MKLQWSYSYGIHAWGYHNMPHGIVFYNTNTAEYVSVCAASDEGLIITHHPTYEEARKAIDLSD